MFNFFKKKEKKQEPEVVEVPLTEEEVAKIKAEIERIQIEIKELETDDPATHEELASRYEQLGLKYAELNDNDDSLTALEKSLDYKLSIGDGYKKLMSLYNGKRAEAARNGDDAGIEYYMQKMDDMRQIAKKVTISGK